MAIQSSETRGNGVFQTTVVPRLVKVWLVELWGGAPPQTITSAVIPSLKSPPPVTIDLLSQGGDSAPSPLTFVESTSSAGQSFNIDEYQLRDAMVARLNKKSSTQNGLSYEVNQMLSVVEGIIAHRETLLNLAYLAEEEMKLTRAADDKHFPNSWSPSCR